MLAPPHPWTIGLNHETAPLDLRARFSLVSSDLPHKLLQVRSACTDLSETLLLSTCNRTELYGVGSESSCDQALAWFASLGGLALHELRPHLYCYRSEAAVRHVLRVASGLDSMVLGEPQILGQVKEAARLAQASQTLGVTLHKLFNLAFSVAKDVRTHTEVGSHSISMAAAATRLAANLFEDWQRTRVLLVGAGEMMELCAVHFAAKNPCKMAIANRTLARAEQLAQRLSTTQLKWQHFSLSELPQHLHEFDVVVSSTSSTLPIIGLGAVQHALAKRKHRPMLMVDLAVPRDIEAEVKDLADIYLYSVDDLSALVQTNLATRAAAIGAAERWIEEGVTQWLDWSAKRVHHVPKIQQLQAKAAHWRVQEIERVKRQFFKTASGQPVSVEDESKIDEMLEALARNLSNKFLHDAIVEIKEKKEPL